MEEKKNILPEEEKDVITVQGLQITDHLYCHISKLSCPKIKSTLLD